MRTENYLAVQAPVCCFLPSVVPILCLFCAQFVDKPQEFWDQLKHDPLTAVRNNGSLRQIREQSMGNTPFHVLARREGNDPDTIEALKLALADDNDTLSILNLVCFAQFFGWLSFFCEFVFNAER